MNQVYRIFEENTRGELGGKQCQRNPGMGRIFLAFSPKTAYHKTEPAAGQVRFSKRIAPFGAISRIKSHRLVTFSSVIRMYFRRIEDLRTDSDKTQKDVADYLNMHLTVYRRYEKGEREIPVWALIKLARLYGTTTDYILGLSDQR